MSETDEDRLLDELEPVMALGNNVVEHHSVGLFPERWFDLVLVLRTDNTLLYDRLAARCDTGRKAGTLHLTFARIAPEVQGLRSEKARGECHRRNHAGRGCVCGSASPLAECPSCIPDCRSSLKRRERATSPRSSTRSPATQSMMPREIRLELSSGTGRGLPSTQLACRHSDLGARSCLPWQQGSIFST